MEKLSPESSALMPKRVAVFGSTGQFGSDFVEILGQDSGFETVALRHEDADCTDRAAVREALHSIRPQIVINCAAFVRVDECEDRPEEAFRVNAIGAFHIAKACAELNALCVYVSTDYVFDGKKESPYVESDPPNPINVYGASKLAGENLVRQAARRWLIVRVASLFGKTGARGKGGNFIEMILAKAKREEPLTVVNDIRISPTYTRGAAKALIELIEQGETGIVHLTNSGSCTWFEFAKEIIDRAHQRVTIEPVSSANYRQAARRPKNSALTTLRSYPCLPSWQDALAAYFAEKQIAAGPARYLVGLSDED